MSVTRLDSAGWYRRNYPEGPVHDARCLAVLLSLAPIYRLPITGRQRKDGGIRVCGDGIKAHFGQGTDFSTFDASELTTLVLAAHKYRCRVSISHRGSVGVLMIHPRETEGGTITRHPGLEELAARIDKMMTTEASS